MDAATHRSQDELKKTELELQRTKQESEEKKQELEEKVQEIHKQGEEIVSLRLQLIDAQAKLEREHKSLIDFGKKTREDLAKQIEQNGQLQIVLQKQKDAYTAKIEQCQTKNSQLQREKEQQEEKFNQVLQIYRETIAELQSANESLKAHR